MKKNIFLTMGICNVRSLHEVGSVHKVQDKMRTINIDIVYFSEVKWLSPGKCQVDNHIFYHWGKTELYHYNAVETFWKICNKSTPDRVLLIQWNNKPVSINILKIYDEISDELVDEMDEEINIR